MTTARPGVMPCSDLRRCTWPAIRVRRPSAKLLPSMIFAVMGTSKSALRAAIENVAAFVYGLAAKCRRPGMTEQQTRPDTGDVDEFLAQLDDPAKRADSYRLIELMQAA